MISNVLISAKPLEVAKQSKVVSLLLMGLKEDQRNLALKNLAKKLRENKAMILSENEKDYLHSKEKNLKASLLNRLLITEKLIEQMAQSCELIADAPQVVGQIVSSVKRADGLLIEKQKIPLGVIAMIFESRPNVVIDASALAIKSGNALIFKGGSDAQYSNRILFQVVEEAIQNILPMGTIQMLESRSEVDELLVLNQYINLVIPRGGEALVKMVRSKATMPVIAHDRGLCHLYIHEDAPWEMAEKIVTNAKISRPGVCNSVETLIIHQNFQETKKLIVSLLKHNVELKVDETLYSQYKDLGVTKSSPQDYHQEWLDLVLCMKMVDSVEGAVKHIQHHGTNHTEGIISQNPSAIEYFLNHLDASCIVVNASTRFNDGGELGLGAEMGISTSKLHAYGPMGANELTTARYVVKGVGHIR
ncbi:MAG: glutamate-5-semialdehyde dehydrogenase [Bacteriovoracaceae bacterium]|nr:glutamate-5-semialdehyde dehydrogenase [Bacteriovoracaceae bacterium]